MSFERGIPNYWEWLLGDPAKLQLFQPQTWGFLWGALAMCFLLLLVAPFLCFVIASFQYGPSEAFYYVARNLFSAVTQDLPRFSFRRTLAISRLAVQEAVRNRVLVGFGVFVILLLFAGLFLDVKNSNPARVYLSFVLGATNFLVIVMALVLSAFSLPNDIKNKTIYTVVTKPIRAGEIILGRTLGFILVGTVMLALMGTISYVFVRRGLAHDHELVAADLTEVTLPGGKKIRHGQTSFDAHHRHAVEIDEDGHITVDPAMGHTHDMEVIGEGAGAKYRISSPKGSLLARAPIFGKLQIFGKDGRPSEKGINVGNEWEYRGYIEGGTPGTQTRAAAVWTFEGITPERFPPEKFKDGLPLEMNLRVFRTHKGDIEQGVLGEIVIRNPNPDSKVKRSGPILFQSKEFVTDHKDIPWELNTEAGGTGQLDLFRDLVHNGTLQVEIRCVDAAQYFGVAQPDVYLRPADSTFEMNFAKAYLSIWLQMALVTSFGVTFSTFLSGAVAMMATLSAIALGFFGEFARDVASGAIEGGGPIESFIRIITQQNVQTDLEINSFVVSGMKWIDAILTNLLRAATYVLPDYTQFDTSAYVADGYSILGAVVAQQVTMAAVYVLAATVVGYFFLKTREIAA